MRDAGAALTQLCVAVINGAKTFAGGPVREKTLIPGVNAANEAASDRNSPGPIQNRAPARRKPPGTESYIK